MINKIPVNIWDDYCEDDGGNTYAYIEDCSITDKEKELMMKVVFDYINTLDMTGVEVIDGDEDIYFENLSYDRLDELVKELEQSGLKYNGIPFEFYSES